MNEVNEQVRELINEANCYKQWQIGNRSLETSKILFKAADTIKSLSKILEQYKKIGTVEEFKALKDKATPRKPAQIDNCGNKCTAIRCQTCFEIVGGDYCGECGQRQDWEAVYNERKG